MSLKQNPNLFIEGPQEQHSLTRSPKPEPGSHPWVCHLTQMSLHQLAISSAVGCVEVHAHSDLVPDGRPLEYLGLAFFSRHLGDMVLLQSVYPVSCLPLLSQKSPLLSQKSPLYVVGLTTVTKKKPFCVFFFVLRF